MRHRILAIFPPLALVGCFSDPGELPPPSGGTGTGTETGTAASTTSDSTVPPPPTGGTDTTESDPGSSGAGSGGTADPTGTSDGGTGATDTDTGTDTSGDPRYTREACDAAFGHAQDYVFCAAENYHDGSEGCSFYTTQSEDCLYVCKDAGGCVRATVNLVDECTPEVEGGFSSCYATAQGRICVCKLD